jgi:AAA domain
MNLTLRKSSRSKSKIRMALEGPSGSGKTYSALLLAKGMVDQWEDIALVDTENGSGDLYSHLGDYNIIGLDPPQSPERYIEAIEICEKQGIKVLILDSLSQGWEYLLEVHSNMIGNSFTNWGKITPRQNALIQKILSSNLHIIATMRTKQDYVINQKNGKAVPEKIGLKAIQRDGVDYEFTIVLDLDIKHQALASKDRTNLFMDSSAFTITEETGAKILAWCNEGLEDEKPSLQVRINECKSLKELLLLYNTNPKIRAQYSVEFTDRKRALTIQVGTSSLKETPVESAEVEASSNGKGGNHG